MIDACMCGYSKKTSNNIEVFFNAALSEDFKEINIKKVIFIC